jgi:predicted HAD superfamily Cof-like phosphohydrolase
MSKVFSDVAQFMNACGQHFPTIPQEQESDLNKLYLKLIKEEYTEFLEAVEQKDNTEQLDACFDMMWVIIGYMHSKGWDCNASWEEGAQSNLSKINNDTGKVIRREDGKILKPEGWQEPNFKQFV